MIDNYGLLMMLMDAHPLSMEEFLKETWSFKTLKLLFLFIVRGVKHAHSKMIAHCDLKPANIMISKDMMPIIIDWGVAVNTSISKENYGRGSPAYRAPEMSNDKALKFDFSKADSWSLGIILFQMFYGYVPIDDKDF